MLVDKGPCDLSMIGGEFPFLSLYQRSGLHYDPGLP